MRNELLIDLLSVVMPAMRRLTAVDAGDAPPHDIRDAVPLVFGWGWPQLLMVVYGLSALAVLVALLLWWRRHRRRPTPAPDPLTAALARLQAMDPDLQEAGAVTRTQPDGDVNRYYLELGHALRSVLALREEMPATGFTNLELARAVINTGRFDRTKHPALEEFASRMDSLAFGSQAAWGREALRQMQADYRLVRDMLQSLQAADPGERGVRP